MFCPSMGPKWFWTVQIIFVEYQLFWTDPIHFGQVQIILNMIQMIWTLPKWIGLIQNNWYSIKIIWTVQNHFGTIEGQGISVYLNFLNKQDFCLFHVQSLHWKRWFSTFLFRLGANDRKIVISIELVSKELNHLAAILHIYAWGLIFMK